MIYRVMWWTIGLLIKAYFLVRARDRQHLPRREGAIIAANHRTAIDPVIVCMAFWRQVVWLAKVELVLSKKIAWFFRGAGVIPVNRETPEDEWIDAAVSVLKENKLFGIFPEGTRSPDGRVYRGYTGVARVAQRSGAPVIPAAITGTDRRHRKGARFVKPGPCRARFGAPMHFDIRPGEDEAAAYRRFTDEVLDAVAALLGAERVPDAYSRPRAPRSG